MSTALVSPRASSVILVTQDPALVAALSAQVPAGWDVVVVADPAEAEAAISARPLQGAVLDMALAGRQALALARTFLRCQAAGRVVLVAGSQGPATLVGMSLRDQRVDCVFRPLDAPALRECLVPAPPRAGRA